LTAHPFSTYEDPLQPSTAYGNPESESISKFYIHCIKDSFSSWMKPFADRTHRRHWNVQTIEARHNVMITLPKELAQILIKIAD
jgi:hypothetical protein